MQQRDSAAKQAVPWLSQPRRTVLVQFPDSRVFEAPIETPLEEFMRTAYPTSPVPIVAVLARNRLLELTTAVNQDLDVVPVTIGHADGIRIYTRSLTFVLVVAVHQILPDALVYVDHSMTFGGLFCELHGEEPITPELVAQIERRMREIVAADAPIIKERVPVKQAIDTFQARGEVDKVRLLSYRTSDSATLYRLYDVADYFHGYMVPSTGCLGLFALEYSPEGIILRFPRHEQPSELQPVVEYPKLMTVFREYGKWLRVLGVENVGALNDALAAGRGDEVVLVSEALHEHKIAEIAVEIARRAERVRVVLIAGPSASGKTTFSKRLAIQLLAHGVEPKTIALDDYFVDRSRTPRDQSGEYDFEHLRAVDLDLLNEQLVELLAGQEVQLPRYNFITGGREEGDVLHLESDQILLLEGIHGLNPELVRQVPQENVYRIYVSALTQLNLDRYNRVPTTDSRLIRRLVRDARDRGHRAIDTIRRWESVRRGEKQWIFPYQEYADVMFNSALVYELSVLKRMAEPLLHELNPGCLEYVEARRLLSLMRWFLPYPIEQVPPNSILREFLGGSSVRDFAAW